MNQLIIPKTKIVWRTTMPIPELSTATARTQGAATLKLKVDELTLDSNTISC